MITDFVSCFVLYLYISTLASKSPQITAGVSRYLEANVVTVKAISGDANTASKNTTAGTTGTIASDGVGAGVGAPGTQGAGTGGAGAGTADAFLPTVAMHVRHGDACPNYPGWAGADELARPFGVGGNRCFTSRVYLEQLDRVAALYGGVKEVRYDTLLY
jgi:hypothetical protein